MPVDSIGPGLDDEPNSGSSLLHASVVDSRLIDCMVDCTVCTVQ